MPCEILLLLGIHFKILQTPLDFNNYNFDVISAFVEIVDYIFCQMFIEVMLNKVMSHMWISFN
jgi:hypothetical protein